MSYLSPESEGPQVVPENKHHADLEYAGSYQPSMAGFLPPIQHPPPIKHLPPIKQERRICGFRSRTAWAMMITLIILIAIAGLAWGIQGTIQSRNSKHNQAALMTTYVLTRYSAHSLACYEPKP